MKNFVKSIMISIVIVIICIASIILIFKKYCRDYLNIAINSINTTINNLEDYEDGLQPIFEERPTNYSDSNPRDVVVQAPVSGSNYGTLSIPSINIELPIYYGTSKNLLKNGVGHDTTAYLPGQGGSIILMGHNFDRLLGSLPNVNIGDLVQISTTYGEFKYTIYDKKIVKETETEKVPIQKDEEILMIYTCWPINNVTYATQRYVIYAK